MKSPVFCDFLSNFSRKMRFLGNFNAVRRVCRPNKAYNGEFPNFGSSWSKTERFLYFLVFLHQNFGEIPCFKANLTYLLVNLVRICRFFLFNQFWTLKLQLFSLNHHFSAAFFLSYFLSIPYTFPSCFTQKKEVTTVFLCPLPRNSCSLPLLFLSRHCRFGSFESRFSHFSPIAAAFSR